MSKNNQQTDQQESDRCRYGQAFEQQLAQFALHGRVGLINRDDADRVATGRLDFCGVLEVRDVEEALVVGLNRLNIRILPVSGIDLSRDKRCLPENPTHAEVFDNDSVIGT